MSASGDVNQHNHLPLAEFLLDVPAPFTDLRGLELTFSEYVDLKLELYEPCVIVD